MKKYKWETQLTPLLYRYYIQDIIAGEVFDVKYERLLVLLLVLSLCGCGVPSSYPDTARVQSSELPNEVMQGLENTVDSILREQASANSDLQELKHLQISTQQYHSKAAVDVAYSEAKIDLLTEEDVAFAQGVLGEQGYWDGRKGPEAGLKDALTANQIEMGLSVNGRHNGHTICKMRS